MIPLGHGKQRPPTREENARIFRTIVFVLGVTLILYAIISWLVFGHL